MKNTVEENISENRPKKYEKQETRKASSQQVYHQSNRKYALRAWDYNNASQKKISTVLPPPPKGFLEISRDITSCTNN